MIVGAGPTGSALAVRLSDDTTPGAARSVQLLEAGPAPATCDAVPPEVLDGTRMAAARPGHALNWSFTGKVAPGTRRPVPRGRVAGGSGAINGGVFIRGTREDFDAIAALGHPDWSYERVLPSFAAVEHDHDFAGPPHGRRGPVPVRRTFPGSASPLTEAFWAACRGLGYPWEPDKNAPGPPGVGPVPVNVVSGIRHSALLTHLLPHAGRPHLTVRGGVLVRRILFAGTRAIGVEAETEGRVQVVRGDEIVLAAGAIGSARLLLLSGVGPADELADLGIRVVHGAPAVGRAVTDHPGVAVGITPVPSAVPAARTAVVEAALHAVSTAADEGTGARRDGDLEIMPYTAPFTELIPGGAGTPPGEVAFGVTLLRTASSGAIRLASADPHAPPLITYRHLTSAADRARLREGVRRCAEILTSAPLRRLTASYGGPPAAVLGSDRALDTWIGERVSTANHLSGGCAMGEVTDAQGRVHGVTGLRVADSSILPRAPSRGTAATAAMMGEHLARSFPPTLES
ncbi:mycofactocin system GMC family oxidoreductase MftG [Nocardiopsis gilva]|uniref:mycofactocin dehydrogenase MftG n=2 Tax=Nocardiopsis gilva TaxID=280236 RepID=UPI0018DF5F3A|nr:mycofactocin system GMC family oxidoreductase MftG [Nocardiopsis gilva]